MAIPMTMLNGKVHKRWPMIEIIILSRKHTQLLSILLSLYTHVYIYIHDYIDVKYSMYIDVQLQGHPQ